MSAPAVLSNVSTSWLRTRHYVEAYPVVHNNKALGMCLSVSMPNQKVLCNARQTTKGLSDPDARRRACANDPVFTPCRFSRPRTALRHRALVERVAPIGGAACARSTRMILRICLSPGVNGPCRLSAYKCGISKELSSSMSTYRIKDNVDN